MKTELVNAFYYFPVVLYQIFKWLLCSLSAHFLERREVCDYYLRIMVIPFTAWGKKKKSKIRAIILCL